MQMMVAVSLAGCVLLHLDAIVQHCQAPQTHFQTSLPGVDFMWHVIRMWHDRIRHITASAWGTLHVHEMVTVAHYIAVSSQGRH
jgi:hypothetical protein